ncbi:sugar ABC transporter substrate-binding protein [Streptomyces albiaxialis]|uniref:Sugar ABC transporter substrate-binding protein n=1 Tax=Streptomyces albiaxialis TaxID=329523 RepID=A0ABN2VU99_9ACTN
MRRAARTTSVALALATAFGITACGSSGGAGVAADEKQTLTVWAMGTEGEKLGDVAGEYEKAHKNITVKVTPIGWDVAHQKLVSAAAAGKLPDVMQIGTGYMGEFSALGALEPVDTGTFDKKDFFPASWSEYDGEAYGVPWYVETRALFYRTDLAKKAGIKKAPGTWKELRAAAKAYQDKAGTRWGIYNQPGGLDTVQTWWPYFYSAGGSVVKDGKTALDSPAAVKALDMYGSFVKDGLSRKASPPGYDVVKDFGNGKVPMFLGGPWQTNLIAEDQPGLKGKWAVAPVPKEKSSTAQIGGSSLAISKESEHKAAAKKFIKYLTDAKGQADWFERTKDLPANTAAWESGPLSTEENWKVFRKQLETAHQDPVQPKWTEITSKVDAAIESVTQGKATPEEAAEKMQDQASGLVE